MPCSDINLLDLIDLDFRVKSSEVRIPGIETKAMEPHAYLYGSQLEFWPISHAIFFTHGITNVWGPNTVQPEYGSGLPKYGSVHTVIVQAFKAKTLRPLAYDYSEFGCFNRDFSGSYDGLLVRPVEFLTWAKGKGWRLPRALNVLIPGASKEVQVGSDDVPLVSQSVTDSEELQPEAAAIVKAVSQIQNIASVRHILGVLSHRYAQMTDESTNNPIHRAIGEVFKPSAVTERRWAKEAGKINQRGRPKKDKS